MVTTIKRKIKKLLLRFSGRVNHLKINLKCSRCWYGNLYGGFFVNPDILNNESVIYSFGIGEDISFDKDIINNHGCHVFGFDPTPKSIKWVKEQKVPDKFFFYEFGISNFDGITDFFLPKNREYVSGSIIVQDNINPADKIRVQMRSLKSIAKEFGHKKIDVLKMDIEGAEYEVLEDVIKSEVPVSQIVVEFHERFVENGKHKTAEIVKKLIISGYAIFAVSDSYEEVSFINKSVINFIH